MKNTYIWLLLVILLISCKPVEKIVEVPVPQIKTEYIQNDIVHYDSIYIESNSMLRNDTIIQTKIEYKYKFIYKDSIQIKTDTIEIPVIQEKIVEKPYIPKIYIWLSVIGIISIILLVLWAIFKFK